MTVLLVIFILAFAAAAGFLGDLLEAAGIMLVVFIVVGGALGWALYAWLRRVLRR